MKVVFREKKKERKGNLRKRSCDRFVGLSRGRERERLESLLRKLGQFGEKGRLAEKNK